MRYMGIKTIGIERTSKFFKSTTKQIRFIMKILNNSKSNEQLY